MEYGYYLFFNHRGGKHLPLLVSGMTWIDETPTKIILEKVNAFYLLHQKEFDDTFDKDPIDLHDKFPELIVLQKEFNKNYKRICSKINNYLLQHFDEFFTDTDGKKINLKL